MLRGDQPTERYVLWHLDRTVGLQEFQERRRGPEKDCQRPANSGRRKKIAIRDNRAARGGGYMCAVGDAVWVPVA